MKSVYDINPSVKIVVVFLYVGFLIFSTNLEFNVFILLFSFLLIIFTVKNIKAFSSLILAVFIFSSTIFLMNFLFYTKGTTPFTILILHGTYEGLIRGIVLSMRAASIIFLSVGYLFSTEPFSMIQSFMQNLHMPEKIGYALLIALREIHLFRKNIVDIERAILIRKMGKSITLKDRLKMLIPLFAMIVRKGERSAIALEMRGMIIKRKGGYYKDMSISKRDIIFLTFSIVLLLMLFYMSAYAPVIYISQRMWP